MNIPPDNTPSTNSENKSTPAPIPPVQSEALPTAKITFNETPDPDEKPVTELPLGLHNAKLEVAGDEETMSNRPDLFLDTRQLSEAEAKAYIEARRKRNLKKTATNLEPIRKGVLRLELVETRQSIIVPIKEKITLGRPDPITGKDPDVDFTTLAGYRMGVSRYHAEIYWLRDNVLQVCDLGSSNGTYVNNERLQPNVPRNIYNGDEVRLGQLGLYVYYEIQEDATIIPFRGSRD